MDEKERKNLGVKGREHVLKNYSFNSYQERWIEILDKVYEEKGSWENRKMYSPWELLEI